MKSFILSLLFAFLCCQFCSRGYQVHIGESHYPASQQFNFFGSSLIAGSALDAIIEITGVYCDRNIFLDKYPVVCVYSETNGKSFIPLTKKIACKNGDLIKIEGRVTSLDITYSMVKKTLTYNHLEPISFEIIRDTQKIVGIVDREYLKIRKKLEDQITIEQSKLQLTMKPDWDIWFAESENVFIFFSHQYDLMYAANIEFIVDAASNRIKDVFAKEWFKGEM